MASCFSLYYVVSFCVTFFLKELIPTVNNFKTTELKHTWKKKESILFVILSTSRKSTIPYTLLLPTHSALFLTLFLHKGVAFLMQCPGIFSQSLS